MQCSIAELHLKDRLWLTIRYLGSNKVHTENMKRIGCPILIEARAAAAC